MHWKVKRDPYYHSLHALLGQTGIEEAGFFYDTATQNVDIQSSLDWLCTPFQFPKLAESKNPCILLSTGAFCPVHQGHIEMMSIAKETLEAEGYDIIAGYLSPGHDEYISQKTADKAIAIQQRIALIQMAIEEAGLENWLAVDPWEGLFCSVAVNFTDVIYRLECYIEKHLGRKIPIFYVCGGDNARFALTFIQKGHSVVVGRPPYEDRFHLYKNRLKNNKRIHWVEAYNPINSAKIRSQSAIQSPVLKKLSLRVEGQDPRETELIQLLTAHFEAIDLQYLSQQSQYFKALNKHPLISLDSLSKGDYDLAISRCFSFFGLQKLGYSPRPNSPSIDTQLKKISNLNQHFYLFDDDSHSGETLRYAQELLKERGIKIKEAITFLARNEAQVEVLDCRDFLIGGENNGLVVQLQDTLIRVPYCYPYCCPFVRASIFDSLQFSISIWQLNAAYFLQNDILLQDLSKVSQTLFRYIGFELETPMADICEWHIDQLVSYI